MNKFLSLAIVGLASVGIGLASPSVSQAWVYAPGRQPQPGNAAPSYLNNFNNYGYSGNFGYGYGGYGYNSYAYPGYGYSGFGYPAYNGFGYGYGNYGYPGYYNGFNSPFYNNAFPSQFGFVAPFRYGY
jgi:hypothetical protein